LEQYRLVTAEKDLLEKTLGNSIRLVTEILSLASPAAYSRALRIRRITREITANLRVRDAWQYELAALFSQTGCVALPTGLVEKIYNGDTLSRNDTKLYASHPMIGARLLQDVPRMEITAEMIREQLRAYDQFPQVADSPEARKAALGAQILRAALDYDDLRRQGLEHAAAMDSLRERLGKYNPQVLDALQEKPAPVDEWRLLSTDSAGLLVGMVLDENVYSKEGALVMKKGQEISLPYLEQLQKLSDSTGLVEPFRVRVSQRDLQRVQDEQERRLR
jgi:response regulator RpfG family c-di-GMP phosphodiesterase